MNDIITEVQQFFSEPNENIVLVPFDSTQDDSNRWLNVFLNGIRVGYVHFSASDGGWVVTLNKEWGAPRDVRGVVYLHRAAAIERVNSELSQ